MNAPDPAPTPAQLEKEYGRLARDLRAAVMAHVGAVTFAHAASWMYPDQPIGPFWLDLAKQLVSDHIRHLNEHAETWRSADAKKAT